jgi:hypothetical protein
MLRSASDFAYGSGWLHNCIASSRAMCVWHGCFARLLALVHNLLHSTTAGHSLTAAPLALTTHLLVGVRCSPCCDVVEGSQRGHTAEALAGVE